MSEIETKLQKNQSKNPDLDPKDANIIASNQELNKNSAREALRHKPASQIELTAGQGVTLDPHTLKQMFLMGKLTQSQLAHQLKNYNDIVADSVIKEGKHSQVQVIDYREVGRASIAKPGADFKPDAENKAQHSPPPKDIKTARKEANDTDNHSRKRELEKRETNLKNEQNLKQIRVLNNFNDAQIEQKNQHASREMLRQKEMQVELEIDHSKDSSLDKALKRTTGKSRITKNLSEEIKAELEKLKSGPAQNSTDK